MERVSREVVPGWDFSSVQSSAVMIQPCRVFILSDLLFSVLADPWSVSCNAFLGDEASSSAPDCSPSEDL